MLKSYGRRTVQQNGTCQWKNASGSAFSLVPGKTNRGGYGSQEEPLLVMLDENLVELVPVRAGVFYPQNSTFRTVTITNGKDGDEWVLDVAPTLADLPYPASRTSPGGVLLSTRPASVVLFDLDSRAEPGHFGNLDQAGTEATPNVFYLREDDTSQWAADFKGLPDGFPGLEPIRERVRRPWNVGQYSHVCFHVESGSYGGVGQDVAVRAFLDLVACVDGRTSESPIASYPLGTLSGFGGTGSGTVTTGIPGQEVLGPLNVTTPAHGPALRFRLEVSGGDEANWFRAERMVGENRWWIRTTAMAW